jgi:hypothetical protein
LTAGEKRLDSTVQLLGAWAFREVGTWAFREPTGCNSLNAYLQETSIVLSPSSLPSSFFLSTPYLHPKHAQILKKKYIGQKGIRNLGLLVYVLSLFLGDVVLKISLLLSLPWL